MLVKFHIRKKLHQQSFLLSDDVKSSEQREFHISNLPASTQKLNSLIKFNYENLFTRVRRADLIWAENLFSPNLISSNKRCSHRLNWNIKNMELLSYLGWGLPWSSKGKIETGEGNGEGEESFSLFFLFPLEKHKTKRKIWEEKQKPIRS